MHPSVLYATMLQGGEEPVDIATPAILSCNEFRSFWISWEDSINLRIGRGDQPNVNDFMSYQVLKQNFRVNAIGIATKEDTTGEWFVSDIEGEVILGPMSQFYSTYQIIISR